MRLPGLMGYAIRSACIHCRDHSVRLEGVFYGIAALDRSSATILCQTFTLSLCWVLAGNSPVPVYLPVPPRSGATGFV